VEAIGRQIVARLVNESLEEAMGLATNGDWLKAARPEENTSSSEDGQHG
jgi:hypothetical protein